MSLPVYDADGIKAWDQFTIKHEPISSADLMERAATLCAKHILAANVFDEANVFCGTGNNGGDGLVIARLFALRKIKVNVFIVEFAKKRSSDFSINLKRLPSNIKLTFLTEKKSAFQISSGIIIDAIFGSGLNKPVEGWVGDVIDQLNLLSLKRISVDIPSGLFVLDNRKNSLKHVIKAHHTYSFQSPKMPFFFYRYYQQVGDCTILDIGLHSAFNRPAVVQVISRKDIRVKTRGKFNHKGSNGYLLIAAGFEDYAGAAILAARAAFRAGCGYVAVHASADTKTHLIQALPESLYLKKITAQAIQKSNALAVGPGLGKSTEALSLLKKLMKLNLPTVLDADAINLLAENKNLLRKLPANSILTPHPLELERLIGKSRFPEEMLDKQISFSKHHEVFVVQKGAFSKITTPQGDVFINPTGNAGMGSAGMGDALTGIIGSFLAQGYSAKEAALFGTYLHGAAGDLVKRKQGEKGMLASDLIAVLPEIINAH